MRGAALQSPRLLEKEGEEALQAPDLGLPPAHTPDHGEAACSHSATSYNN